MDEEKEEGLGGGRFPNWDVSIVDDPTESRSLVMIEYSVFCVVR